MRLPESLASLASRKSTVRLRVFFHIASLVLTSIIFLVVYNDASRRPDPSAFSKIELWHSDVTYEIQPPSTTSLKVIEGPPYGGDTLWSSG